MIPQGARESDHMGNFRMEVAVREVTRRCRTLWITAEHNTGVRMADDDSPFLSWLPWFAAQIMNYMGIGNEGKQANSEELDEDRESQWRKWERKFDSVILEKMVSVLFCKPYD